ncbi:unnamed protein product [Urochloa humidicola]
MMTVELVFPEVAAVVELLRRRIKMLSGGGGESCAFSGESFVRILQQCPSSWSPWTWRKEIVAGLQFEVAGVEDEDGDITGCVRRYQLYWGVSCKKAGVYCMRL